MTSSPTSPVAAGENSTRSDHRLRRPAGRRRRRIPPKLETFPGPNPSKTRAFQRTSPPLSNNVISPTHFSLSSSLSPSRIPERERGAGWWGNNDVGGGDWCGSACQPRKVETRPFDLSLSKSSLSLSFSLSSPTPYLFAPRSLACTRLSLSSPPTLPKP